MGVSLVIMMLSAIHTLASWSNLCSGKMRSGVPWQTFLLLLCWRSWEVAGSLHHPGGFWQQLHVYEHQRQPLLPRRVAWLRPGWAGGLRVHPGKRQFEYKWNHAFTAWVAEQRRARKRVRVPQSWLTSRLFAQTMLLEKLRVSRRPEAESTFNVFYYMMAGADSSLKWVLL